jgi:hypothetical protein
MKRGRSVTDYISPALLPRRLAHGFEFAFDGHSARGLLSHVQGTSLLEVSAAKARWMTSISAASV